MRYKKLSREDYEAYKILREESLEHEPQSFGTSLEDELKMDQQVRMKNFEKAITQGDNFIMGVFNDTDELVGMAQFTRDARKKLSHKSKLGAVYLTSTARGKDVAYQLISHLLNETKMLNGVEKISLMVVSQNEKAIRLYEKLGFTTYGYEPRAIKFNDVYYDYHLMVLFLL